MITLVVEAHRWRGLSWGTRRAMAWVVAGWLSVALMRGSVIGRGRDLAEILETIEGDDGDDAPNR